MNTERPATIDDVGSIAWAVFFIWAGIALLANVPWGWVLVGFGIITLMAQIARWLLNMNIEIFWATCGVVLLAGGLWTLLKLPWPLAPILLILLGIAMLGKTISFTR